MGPGSSRYDLLMQAAALGRDDRTRIVRRLLLSTNTAVAEPGYPVLSGAFLIFLAAALVLVSWAVGTETYPYIHQRISYRYSLATLDRVYLVTLGILALHYAAYVMHYLIVG